jgi:hypothetical protein
MKWRDYVASITTLEIVRDVLNGSSNQHNTNRRLFKLQVPITTTIAVMDDLLLQNNVSPINIKTFQSSTTKRWYLEYLCYGIHFPHIPVKDDIPYYALENGKVIKLKD